MPRLHAGIDHSTKLQPRASYALIQNIVYICIYCMFTYSWRPATTSRRASAWFVFGRCNGLWLPTLARTLPVVPFFTLHPYVSTATYVPPVFLVVGACQYELLLHRKNFSLYFNGSIRRTQHLTPCHYVTPTLDISMPASYLPRRALLVLQHQVYTPPTHVLRPRYCSSRRRA